MKRHSKQHNRRLISLDILRGVAVCTMILAHTVAFFYSGHALLPKMFQKFGDLVSFTTFLLVSGAVFTAAYLDIPNALWKKKKHNILSRSWLLLGGYYAVGLLTIAPHLFENGIADALWKLLRLLVFIDVPGYSEFILAFLFFGIVIYYGRDFFAKHYRNIDLMIILGVAIYLLGFVIYSLPIPESFAIVTSFLAGYDGWYRFPIFQYFPIFLIGLYLGKFLLDEQNLFYRGVTLSTVAFTSLLLLAFCVVTPPFLDFPYTGNFNRWPPNVSFLLVGTTFAFAALTLIIFLKNMKNPITATLQLWGHNAYIMYIIHILILVLFDSFAHFKTENQFILIPLYIGVMSLCHFIVTWRIRRLNK
ncbi:acyltransferase family protein [Candidatus Dojkabacteria bacterium]|uniref:Acyltransferase family protein n=1 Tax=Candidatus Dojkabacteria bacterium TaxID=2099670 RepID=A0A955L719_9BACT|nr:acyltransferase family protein [Candidatus Dojkabacteria bacterium]